MSERERGHHHDNIGCIDCGSSDSMSLYEHDDGSFNGFCRSACVDDAYKSNNRLAESEYAEEYGIKKIPRRRKSREVEPVTETRQPRKKRKPKAPAKPITDKKRQEIKDNTSAKGKGFRGIDDKWLKKTGTRTAYCEETGEASDRYYPTTTGAGTDKVTLVGYHRRFVLPEKDFRAVGLNSKECDLFNQFNCKGSKRLVLNGGQEDTLAAMQMFEGYRQGKNNIAPVDFVSGTVGETSLAAQIQHNYDFIDRYDEILIDMDGDEAGAAAVEALLKVLPLKKVKLMSYPSKDANQALDDGEEGAYIRAIYNAKKPKVAGIHGGMELLDDMYGEASFDKLPLPVFMEEMNTMMEGGYDFGTFNIIAGDTSVGKTTLVNEISSHIIRCKEHKPVILSLEARKGILTRQYLSLELGKRLGAFDTPEEMKKYVDEHRGQVEAFLTREDGDNSFEVIDDRARLISVEDTFDMMERAICGLGCDVLIIDVLTDLMDSLSIEEQASFNGRIKALIANHNICIIAICHTKKLEGRDKEGKIRVEPTRHDVYGSKTTIGSATSLLLVWRDLQAEDYEEKNTTYAKLDKNRDHSYTGPAGEWFYDRDRHRMMNKRTKGGDF